MMKLTVHLIDPNLLDETYEIGEGQEYRTWYWNCSPTLVGTELANLVIKRWCHPGCRVEIPRERISSITVDTHAHTNDEKVPTVLELANKYNETPQS